MHRYYYREHPQLLVGPDGGAQRLIEIASRHQSARLLVIGEPTALIQPLDGSLLSRVFGDDDWLSRALLATRQAPPAWEQALAEAGIAVAEVSSLGLQAVAVACAPRSKVAAAVSAGARTATLPRLLQDGRQWSSPVAPTREARRALYRALEQYLGDEGLLLLVAVATYPQLHWALTRRLDYELFPEQSAAQRERRLLRIARLPWARSGWLPGWLRAELLRRQSPRERASVRSLYKRLLLEATLAGGARLALQVYVPRSPGAFGALRAWLKRGRRRLNQWLRRLGALSEDDSVLVDAVFADLLFGRTVRLLQLEIPRRLLGGLTTGAMARAIAGPLLLGLALAVAGGGMAHWAWTSRGEDLVRGELLMWQKASHAAYRVEISHRPETAALADALRQTLASDGFEVAIMRDELVLPAGLETPQVWINKIQWSDPADVPMATHIERQLLSLAWDDDPEVTNQLVIWSALPRFEKVPPPRVLRVLLTTPGSVEPHDVARAQPETAAKAKASEPADMPAGGGTGLPSAQTVASVFASLRAAGDTESGVFTLKAPDIAENGAVVPLTIESSVHFDLAWLVFERGCISLQALPRSPAVSGFLSTRVKMPRTGDLVGLARSGDDAPLRAEKRVKVTVGGYADDDGVLCATDAEEFYRDRIDAIGALAWVETTDNSVRIRARRLEDDVVSFHTLISHPMETGARRDRATGELVPAQYIEAVGIYLNEKPMIYVLWGPLITKNPYLSVKWRGIGNVGDRVELRWIDNLGQTGLGSAEIK